MGKKYKIIDEVIKDKLGADLYYDFLKLLNKRRYIKQYRKEEKELYNN